MRRLIIASLGLGLAAASCVNDDGSVFIEGALPLTPDEECNVDAGQNKFVFSGTLDVLTPHSFQAALKVVTNLPSTFNNTDVTSGDTRAPNYPDYGSTDNNVIIIDAAEIDYEFTIPAANVGDVNPDAFECDADTGVCKSNANAPTVVRVSGSVFNKQTSLNSASAVLVEAVSQTVAAELNTAFAGVLTNPTQVVRVVATMRLKGTTTGNGDLRDITTFPFPFPIDVCRGCITPNQDFCEGVDEDADFVATPQDTCFVGQDFPQGQCRCGVVPGAGGSAGVAIDAAGCQ